MTTPLLIICGIRDEIVLILCFVAQSATMPCGYLTELAASPRRNDSGYVVGDAPGEVRSAWWNAGWQEPLSKRIAPFLLGIYIHAPTWGVFLYTFYSNVSKEEKLSGLSPPDWVYGAVIGQVILFTSFTFPLVIYQTKSPHKYWQTEMIYAVLSLVAKTVLNGQMLANVLIVGRLQYDN